MLSTHFLFCFLHSFCSVRFWWFYDVSARFRSNFLLCSQFYFPPSNMAIENCLVFIRLIASPSVRQTKRGQFWVLFSTTFLNCLFSFDKTHCGWNNKIWAHIARAHTHDLFYRSSETCNGSHEKANPKSKMQISKGVGGSCRCSITLVSLKRFRKLKNNKFCLSNKKRWNQHGVVISIRPREKLVQFCADKLLFRCHRFFYFFLQSL